MTGLLRQTWAIYAKDVTVEWRTREVLYTSLLFSAVLLSVFVFAGFGDLAERQRAAPGVLWVSLCFVGTLIFGRTFQREREERAVAALLLVPGVIDALFLAKLGVNITLLVMVECVLVPSVALTFHVPLLEVGGPMVALLGLGTLGFCALGTVLAAALASLRLREVLLPLVLFPLCLPLLVAGVRGTAVALDGGGWAAASDWIWLLVAFDLLFFTLSRWLFREAVDGAA